MEKAAAEAIVRLSGGDMRKVLNILESCSLAYRKITVQKIYEVTGRPSPEDIETIYTALTTDGYTQAFDKIVALKVSKSLALDDIIRDIHKAIMET